MTQPEDYDPLEDIDNELAELEAVGRRRQRSVIDGPDSRQIVMCSGLNGGTRHKLINWAGNDYLGLATDRRVMNAAARALRTYGAGAGASRLLAGGLRCHRRLEQRLSHWLGVEDVVVTTSGYQANLAALVALAGSTEDVIIVDRLAHASTYDGLRLSAASMLRFAHNDVEDLAKKLQMSVAARRKIVCVESVYSMDGDEAPLREIAALCAAHKALLVVDEDHAIGVLGAGGRGLCAELGVYPDVLVGTASKGLGSQGGFIAGRSSLIELIANRGRSFIFSTAPVPAAMGAAVASLDVLKADPERPDRLQARCVAIRSALRDQGWNVGPGRSAIIPVIIGNEDETLSLSQRLRDAGHYAPAIRPPTVPAATCRLRLSPSLAHTEADVRRLLQAMSGLR